MQSDFTDEQDSLRDAVRSFFGDRSAESDVRRLMETGDGFDPAVWAGMAGMGLLGLAVPTELGGSGGSVVELGIVFEEAGAAMLCAPLFSTTVLAAAALLHAGDNAAAARYLPAIADGSLRAALALTEGSGQWDKESIATVARQKSGGWLIDGEKTFVPDGHSADLVIVVAQTAAGIALFAVDGDATGLTRTPLRTLDLTRKQARLELVKVPGTLIGSEGDAWPIISHVLDLAAVVLAAEQVGGAQRVLDMTVSYVKDRRQFGRTIGSFQAVKHTCADLLVEVESARSVAQFALFAAGARAPDLPMAASLAKSVCSDVFTTVTTQAIQLHGGIGFTWEHPAHLYFKRARSSQVLLGDSTYHRELLAQRIGI